MKCILSCNIDNHKFIVKEWGELVIPKDSKYYYEILEKASRYISDPDMQREIIESRNLCEQGKNEVIGTKIG